LFTETGVLKGISNIFTQRQDLLKFWIKKEHYKYGTWVDDCGITLLFGNKLVLKQKEMIISRLLRYSFLR